MTENLPVPAPEPSGQVILYQSRDGTTRIEVRLEGDTVWLPQRLIAELFQVSVPTVNEHLKGIYDDHELDAGATIRNFRIVQTEGTRQVSRQVEHYNLDAIIAVVYSNAKQPADNGPRDAYRIVTPQLLADAGWQPDLPEELAKKIEIVWASKDRPSSEGWQWWDHEQTTKAGGPDAFLAKNPKLDKYIKDFIATLDPADAKKYGEHIKRRLCVDAPRNKWNTPNGLNWEALVNLSKLQNTGHTSLHEWGRVLGKIGAGSLTFPAWRQALIMTDTIYCLDAATGKELWKKAFPEDNAYRAAYSKHINRCMEDYHYGHFFLLGASGTPAVWNGRCYAAGGMGLYCLSAKDGTLIWHAKGQPQHSSVLVADGIVYNGGDGCAYDAEKGTLLWKNPAWHASTGRPDDTTKYSAPLLWASGGNNYVITTDGLKSYCCLALKTGKLLWTLKTDPDLFTTLRGALLVVPAQYGSSGTQAFKLTPDGAQRLWKKGFHGGYGNVIEHDHLYALDKCVDIATGEVNWKSRLGIDTLSPIVLADGKIIVPFGSSHVFHGGSGDLSYRLTMFKATADGFVKTGDFNPRACVMCSPAVAGGKLYVRLTDRVACYDLQKHGVYLDAAIAGKDAVTFHFKQTGGGLVPKDREIKDVVLTQAGATSKPAEATIDGDTIVVDIRSAALPFSIAYAGGKSLSGKNGLPVPPFAWSLLRLLKYRNCFDNTIVLTSDLPLQQDGAWNRAETFSVAGAKVTQVDLDPQGKAVKLTTDNAWKPGDAVAVTYPCFPAVPGQVRRETLNFTVAAPQHAAARFVKADDTTSGSWKGVFGADGQIIVGDKGASPPKYAMVAPTNVQEQVPWAATPANPVFLQKTGQTKDHSITSWAAIDQIDLEVEITDGKEHQVAVYCMDWGGQTVLAVEARDPQSDAVLDSQTVKDFRKGKYLVWNLKGQVKLRLTNTKQAEGTETVVQGLFFDPPASPGAAPSPPSRKIR